MIEIIIEDEYLELINQNEVQEKVEKITNVLNLGMTDICLNICDDSLMKLYNQKYRGFNKTTDVLSFNMNMKDPETDKEYLGDILISFPQAKLQSIDHQITIEEEILYLLIHGILHLKGFDHSDKNEEAIMFSLQDEVFKKIK